MSMPVELVESSVESDWRISWTFRANLADLPDGTFMGPKLQGLPLKGTWQLRVYRKEGKTRFACNYGSLPYGTFGDKVTVEMRLDVVHGGLATEIRKSTWGPKSSPDVRAANESKTCTSWAMAADIDKFAEKQPWFQPLAAQPQTYRLTASLRNCAASATGDDVTRGARQALLVTCEAEDFPSKVHADDGPVDSDPDSTRAPKNVCLFFPRQATVGHRLWTTASFLEESSAYFKAMLASECVETIPGRRKRQRTEDIKPDVDLTDDGIEKDWDDSDDEADNLLAPADDDDDDDEDDDRKFRQITVREFALSTYRAVLLYLKTGHVVFAPLRSSFHEPRAADQHESRATFLADYAEKNPELPLSASPKSVYRLAHLLQLADLQAIALERIAASLSTHNAAYELFSPVAIAYDGVREVVIDYVVKHFGAVQEAESWREQRDKAMRGEIEGGAVVFAELLAAQFKAQSKLSG